MGGVERAWFLRRQLNSFQIFPDDLRQIYEKATDDDPKKRYQKARDMLEVIETFASTLESPVTENASFEMEV